MTGIRHFTASAIVRGDHDRVLLVHHKKVGRWLYPGVHLASPTVGRNLSRTSCR